MNAENSILTRDTKVVILGYEAGWEYYSYECNTCLGNVMMEIQKRWKELGCHAIYEIKLVDCYGPRLASVRDTMIVDDSGYEVEEGLTFEEIVTQDGRYPVEVEEVHFSVETYLEDVSATLEEKIEFLKRYRQAKLEQRMAERVGNGNDGDEEGQ